jgi:hypothetical protein
MGGFFKYFPSNAGIYWKIGRILLKIGKKIRIKEVSNAGYDQ